MRIVIQRCHKAQVTVDEEVVGKIEKGLTLLVCLEKGDTLQTIEKAARKVLQLRTFTGDESGKMNADITQVQGQILSISQFTLSWKGAKGNRPSFDHSMPPDEARKLFTQFNSLLAQACPVETGQFGAMMRVSIENEGPVTYCVDF